MRTTIGSFLMTAGVMGLSAGVSADGHMQSEMQFGPAEIMICGYNEGQRPEDLMKLTDAFTGWVKENDPGYSYWLLSPQYHEDASEWDFIWLGAWPSGAGFGAGFDAWMKDDDDIGEMFEDVMECNYSMASVTTIAEPEGDDVWERGVVWFQRCMRKDGVKLSDAIAAHRTTATAMAAMGETSASYAFLPALGFGDSEVDYYHVQSWPSHGQLGASFDNYFNKGGWEVVAEQEGYKSECHSPNLYTFRLMHAAGS